MDDTQIKRQITGRRNRAAGAAFESAIEASCLRYRHMHIAIIEKTPEPVKQLAGMDSGGRFRACYTKQAQPDFKGALFGGRAVVFDAKHTDSDRIRASCVTPEQAKSLANYNTAGALAFVAVSLRLMNFYSVPWPAWAKMKETYGRAYMTEAELEPFRAPLTGIIEFLHPLLPEGGGAP